MEKSLTGGVCDQAPLLAFGAETPMKSSARMCIMANS